jgi:GNAT superfamily N-acetyltransferase
MFRCLADQDIRGATIQGTAISITAGSWIRARAASMTPAKSSSRTSRKSSRRLLIVKPNNGQTSVRVVISQTTHNRSGSTPACCTAPVADTIITMTGSFIFLDRLPSADEHRRLAEAVGWAHAFDWETVPASLDGSLAGAVAIEGNEVIGMARLVGDGVKYFYVQDVAVLPTHQGLGIGSVLLSRLMDYVARTAPATAFVGLFATNDAVALYQREGFTTGDMTGMFRPVESTKG